MLGKVKFFNPIKGFGFIETKEGDLFFHISEFDDYKKVKIDSGDEVEFEVGSSRRGKKATNIKKVEKEN